jgi:hypothetical protein
MDIREVPSEKKKPKETRASPIYQKETDTKPKTTVQYP